MKTNDADARTSILTALGRSTLLVRDQDEALAFYRDKLGFEVLYDGRNPDGFRALHIGLPGQRQEPRVGLWLIPARNSDEQALVGRQAEASRCLWSIPTIADAPLRSWPIEA
jgi:hypothetical protein